MELQELRRLAAAGQGRHGALRCLAATGLIAAALHAIPAAAQPVCLLDNDAKVCVSFDSVIPADAVQPTAEGGTPTFIDYQLTVSNLGQTSTRNVSFDIATSPQATIADFSSGLAGCTVNGSTVNCVYDKLDAPDSFPVHVTVQVPDLQAPNQPDYALTNTVTFGWNGNVQTATYTNTVSVSSGASYVPTGQEVTLVTGPEAADRSLQTDPDHPKWAKLTIPADFSHDGFYAKIEVVDDGPTFDCPTGIFIETHEDDAGLYVCRDVDQPNRWIKTTFSENWLFEFAPLKWEVVWDSSIVPLIQLPPTPIAPTGTPPLAVFHRGGEVDAETRAYSKTCGDNPTPCISAVQQFGTGDWTAEFYKKSVGAAGYDNDTSQNNLLDTSCPLGGCVTIQDLIPPIGQGFMN